MNKTLGHYACVLVDLDLSGQINDQVLVERTGSRFLLA